MAEWQPIETAPKDGVILLYKPPAPHEGASTFAGYWAQTHDWMAMCGGWMPVAGAYVHENCTHWMPLPEPPPGIRT